MASTLRPLPAQPQLSPTSSGSSHTTTPTSPHFLHHAQSTVPRYASPRSFALPSDVRPPSQASRPPTPPLLRAPPDQSFPAYLKTWGNGEVATFLGLYRCGHYAPVFQNNDIDGKVLLDLDMASLKEMGVSKVGERVKLLGGVKDLRKRAAASGPVGLSRVELRLNGAPSPPIDDPPPPPPPAKPLPTEKSSGRRLNAGRPPPLDLQPHVSSRQLPQAYQNNPGSDATAVTRAPSLRSRPAPLAQSSSQSTITASSLAQGSSSSAGQTRSSTPSNNLSSSQTSQTSQTTLSSQGSSVPGPARANLRPPPARYNSTRRSPSPSAEAASFAGRPLPPAPAQSSAAEYASSITQQRDLNDGKGTPSYDSQFKGSASRSGPPVSAPRSDHRKQSSLALPTKTSPIKNKFSAIIGSRPNTNSGPVHPFAANRSRDDDPPRRASPPFLEAPLSNRRHPSGGYVVGSGGMINSKTAMNDARARRDVSQPQAALAIDDIRRQVVKFINKEDGTSRTVNVASCTSGVEVLERVLKKFGKWNTTNSISTDGESDEDGDRLEVDGWGVYAESEPDDECEESFLSFYSNAQ